jgi:hypothetical protein
MKRKKTFVLAQSHLRSAESDCLWVNGRNIGSCMFGPVSQYNVFWLIRSHSHLHSERIRFCGHIFVVQ